MTQILINSLIAGSIYALVAMSFNLAYGVSRAFNLAHGVVGAIAAYTVFFLASENGVSLVTAIFVGIVVASFASVFLEMFVFRPLREKRASNLIILIASLGVMIVVEAFIAILFSNQFKTLLHILPHNVTVSIGGSAITEVQAVMVALSFCTLLAFWFLLSKTRFGKTVRAISDDEEVAKIVGIDTNRIITVVFLISGAVMGMAGILAGFDTGLEPHMGFLLILGGAVASIIGGTGSVYGAFIGAYLLGFVENFGVWFFSAQIKYAIAMLVLILFLLFRPQGFFGKK